MYTFFSQIIRGESQINSNIFRGIIPQKRVYEVSFARKKIGNVLMFC